MKSAQKYRQLAERHRRIAAKLPFSAFRQRFLLSADRLEALAQASSELNPRPNSED